MFEKRIRIFGIFLVLVTVGLIVRAVQLQVVDQQQLAERPVQWTPIETARGSIRDVKGREIARDEACIDACVDYRAIQSPADEKWLKIVAKQRKVKKEEILGEIDAMWATLAKLPGESRESIEELRRSIVQKVEMRRRYVWYYRYQQALDENKPTTQQAWYRRWLEEDDRNVDDYSVTVDEQTQKHPILRAVSPEVNNFLAKQIEHMPGMELRAGTKRVYPYGRTGCHLVGNLTKISREDIKAGINDGTDELTRYEPNDLIGRSGLEALCEKTLRGKRGRKGIGTNESVPPQIGNDAATTVDIELQKEIEEIFEEKQWHGAAVVIDVPTNEVRVLASNPGFDPNDLEKDYANLAMDELNHPLLNRATQAMLEPGSTVKPMMGLGAITSGIITPSDTIACNGFLYLSGRRMAVGRCWTEQMYHLTHREVPSNDPHPTGMLTVTDAIERSCNVFFETLADRMGPEMIATWFGKFGLGRPTGIGIAEANGRLPKRLEGPEARMSNCYCGIGQGQVGATPIQMANVAATIARDGIWMRPKLVGGKTEPMDLQLSREALDAVKTGMIRVVNSPAGSAYKSGVRRSDILIAGKTGTAQAAPFMLNVKGPDGKITKVPLKMNTKADPNPDAPWYRGTGISGQDLAHAWFIGFAPARNPQIAFCVFVEYGGGGGSTAAEVAKDVIEKCSEHGYLTVGNSATAMAQVP